MLLRSFLKAMCASAVSFIVFFALFPVSFFAVPRYLCRGGFVFLFAQYCLSNYKNDNAAHKYRPRKGYRESDLTP